MPIICGNGRREQSIDDVAFLNRAEEALAGRNFAAVPATRDALRHPRGEIGSIGEVVLSRQPGGSGLLQIDLVRPVRSAISEI